ncbi:hypothetical protein KR026_000400, partial [Drosophila bipectinata]
TLLKRSWDRNMWKTGLWSLPSPTKKLVPLLQSSSYYRPALIPSKTWRPWESKWASPWIW